MIMAMTKTLACGRADRKIGDRRAGAQAGDSPADAEQRGARDQSSVDRCGRRQMEVGVGKRRAAARCQPPCDRHRQQRAGHDERQRRIPTPSKIEEGAHPCRVGHARNGEPCAEQQAAGERENRADAHQPNPSRFITATVTKPAAMNVAVAANERGDRRDRPQTPCPLVQPLPEARTDADEEAAHQKSGEARCEARLDRAGQQGDERRSGRQAEHERGSDAPGRAGLRKAGRPGGEAADAGDAPKPQQHRRRR